MQNDFEDTTSDKEIIFRRSKNAFIIQMVVAFLFIPFFGIGIILGIAFVIQYFTHELVVRQKTITYKRGLIGSYTKEIPFSKINGVNIEQGAGGKLFGYGSVKVVTGNDIDTIKFDTIENPERVKALIQKLVDHNDPGHRYQSQNVAAQAQPTKMEELEKLAEMKEKGHLTEEEFAAEKKKLLDQ